MTIRTDHMNYALEVETQFSELVGDLSEGVYSCSYNDHDIFSAAFKGYLNESIETTCSYERQRCMGMIESHMPEDKDYMAEVIRRVRSLRGWPEGWYAPLTPLDKLHHMYRELLIDEAHRDLLEPETLPQVRLTGYRVTFPVVDDPVLSEQTHYINVGEDPEITFRRNGIEGQMATYTNASINGLDVHIQAVYDPATMRILSSEAWIEKNLGGDWVVDDNGKRSFKANIQRTPVQVFDFVVGITPAGEV